MNPHGIVHHTRKVLDSEKLEHSNESPINVIKVGPLICIRTVDDAFLVFFEAKFSTKKEHPQNSVYECEQSQKNCEVSYIWKGGGYDSHLPRVGVRVRTRVRVRVTVIVRVTVRFAFCTFGFSFID